MAISTYALAIWAIIFGSTLNVVTCAIVLDFRAMPSVVQPLVTKNVTIQCVANEETQYYQQKSYHYNEENHPSRGSVKSDIYIIRILKNYMNAWQVIAQISKVTPTNVHKLDKSVNGTEGHISDDLTKNSFLKVSWDTATLEAFGTYRCDTISFDSYQNAILTTSSRLELGSTLNAQDFLRLLKHDLTDFHKTVVQQEQRQKLDHDLIELLKTKLETLEETKQKDLEANVTEQGLRFQGEVQKINKKITDMENEISDKIGEVDLKVNTAVDSGYLIIWPRGSYGLPQPDTGCSSSGVTKWKSGWVRHHTESTDRNRDELSAEAHLRKPTLERESGNNFVTQHFCIKADSSSLGPNWPRGSYCINKKENCPDLFDEGYIKWDEENDNTNAQTFDGSVPDGISNGTQITTIEYCCRQDGPAEEPIYLPNSDPFYLYRHGGNCQQVNGMIVTEEFILFDTENTDNKDEFGTVHPDGRINNIRLELCYYRRV